MSKMCRPGIGLFAEDRGINKDPCAALPGTIVRTGLVNDSKLIAVQSYGACQTAGDAQPL